MQDRFTHEGVIYETQPDGTFRVVGYADAPAPAPGPAPMTFGTPDPYRAPRAEIDLEKTRADLAKTLTDLRNSDRAPPPAGYRYVEDGSLAAIPGGPADPNKFQLTDAARTNLQGEITKLANLRGGIDQLRQLYAEGPGSTKGVSGLTDYLPYDRNIVFDDAGARLPAFVATALGLTGQQFNTPAEQALFIGSYIPKAGDRDAQIERKINALEAMYQNAMGNANRMLSGEPPKPITDPAQPDPDFSGVTRRPSAADASGRVELADGEWRMEKDPARAGVNERLSALLNGGASDAQVKAFLTERGISTSNIDDVLAQRRRNPNLNFAADLETRMVQMTPQERARNDEGKTPIAAFFGSAANALTAGALPEISGDPNAFRMGLDAQRRLNPLSSLAGTVAGGALAAGGAEVGAAGLAARTGLPQLARFAPMTGDALYGGAVGYNEGGDLSSTLTGAGAGVLGGVLGRQLTRGGASAVGGVRDAAVDELRTRGIPLTFGQTVANSGFLGRAAKGLEDRMSGIPVVGDMINARRAEGLQGFNRAAFDEALAPIGGTAGDALGEEAVARARGLVGDAYDTALGGVRVNADAPFIGDMRNAFGRADALPNTMAENARYTLNTRVGESFDPNGGMTGRDFQQALRGLRRDAGAVRSQPYGYDFGEVTRGAEDALTGMVTRQAPGVVEDLGRANEAYGRVGIVRDAVGAARNGSRSGEGGMFMPSQLSDAASRNARRFGGTQATPDQPFYGLTTASRDILPSRVPDSGTAGRLATLALPGALGGGGYVTDSVGLTDSGAQTGLGLGAALTLGGTRAGQSLLTGAVSRRPEAARRLADEMRQRAWIGGMFGAGATPILLAP